MHTPCAGVITHYSHREIACYRRRRGVVFSWIIAIVGFVASSSRIVRVRTESVARGVGKVVEKERKGKRKGGEGGKARCRRVGRRQFAACGVTRRQCRFVLFEKVDLGGKVKKRSTNTTHDPLPSPPFFFFSLRRARGQRVLRRYENNGLYPSKYYLICRAGHISGSERQCFWPCVYISPSILFLFFSLFFAFAFVSTYIGPRR